MATAPRRLRLAGVRRLGIAVAIAALAVCAPAGAAGVPQVQARAYVVQSSVDGHTLATRDADVPRPMASITKLMTALVALEHLRLDETVTVPALAARIGESSLDLRAGQRISVRDLLIGTLVPSANDAATTLAVAAGGSERRFVALMNRKARELGLRHTRYRNPHGLDQPGHVSTARDAALLLRAALRVPEIRRFAGMSRATLSDGRVVESTDNLLGRFSGVVGGKTGHTSLAGWSQVAFARRGSVGITVAVLGSPSEAQRDSDLAALLRFGLASYRIARVVDPARTYAAVPVGWGEPPVRAVAPRAIVRATSVERPVSERIVVPAVAALPVRAGQRLGTVVVTDGSRVVARSPLVAATSRPAPSLGGRAWWVTRRTAHQLVGLVS
jgi:D-alanyl-D-alanine carboxypeptidase (penicillin-binding protein 5/6)